MIRITAKDILNFTLKGGNHVNLARRQGTVHRRFTKADHAPGLKETLRARTFQPAEPNRLAQTRHPNAMDPGPKGQISAPVQRGF